MPLTLLRRDRGCTRMTKIPVRKNDRGRLPFFLHQHPVDARHRLVPDASLGRVGGRDDLPAGSPGSRPFRRRIQKRRSGPARRISAGARQRFCPGHDRAPHRHGDDLCRRVAQGARHASGPGVFLFFARRAGLAHGRRLSPGLAALDGRSDRLRDCRERAGLSDQPLLADVERNCGRRARHRRAAVGGTTP